MKVRAIVDNRSATLCLLASMLQANVAFADVAPPDRCNQEGAPCNNAGGVGAQTGMPGICQPNRCQRAGPDGTVVYYDCLSCIAGQGGAAGAGMAGSGGNGTDESCTCHVMRPSNEQSLAGLMLLMGLLALGWSRKKGAP